MDFLSSEYRWKIVEPEGTSHKGEWMKNKETCIQDFFDKNPGQTGLNEIYLYKRFKLPDRQSSKHILLIGARSPKYGEFKWKVNYVLAHRTQGPEKTWIHGEWMKKAADCVKDYLEEVIVKGYDIMDCACETDYLYMRRPFPIQKELKRSFECLLL